MKSQRRRRPCREGIETIIAAAGGATRAVTSAPVGRSAAERTWESAVSASAPAVGGFGRAHQRVAQFPQLGALSALVDGRCEIFGSASDLVDAVGQLGRLVGGQYHRVGRQRRALDHRALFVGALPTGLAAVLTSPAHPGVGDFTTAPSAWLRTGTTCHGTR